jgi:hypothetical protein
MKNKTLLKATGLLFFVLFQLHSSGQTKVIYEGGIVELNNRQTVVGHIKKGELPDMLSRISFKHDLTDENSITYDTAQIRRYWIGSKDTYELLRFSVNNPAEPVTTFAKLLVRGDASLYKTMYKEEVLYIVKRDNQLFVLQNNKPASSNSKTPVGAADYKNQLTKALGKSLPSSGNAGNVAYTEKNFIALVSAYNNAVNSPNDILLAKAEPISFLLATVGGGLQQNDGKEIFLHTAYRTFFPDLSRNTSLNVGFNFYASQYSEIIKINFYDYQFDYTSLLFTVPVEVQHNLLNKNIRPFVSAGFTFAYHSLRDQYGNTENKVFKNGVGIRPVYSGGVEADFSKNFFLKAAYRKEVFSHLVLVGVGYNFSK